MILVVTYDLKQPASSYSQLYEVLKSYDSWAHYMNSTWFIATNSSPKELYEELQQFIHEGDRILIMRLSSGHYGWMPKKAWDWVSKHED